MDFENAPSASDVIKALEYLIEKHGDLPVCADDPDTKWRLEIGVAYKPENTIEGFPERFEIKTDYNFPPEGQIMKIDI